MKKKKNLWSGVSMLIVAVLAVTAFIRGKTQIWLYIAAFAAWSGMGRCILPYPVHERAVPSI